MEKQYRFQNIMSNSTYVEYFLIFFIILIIVVLLMYVFTQINKKKQKNTRMRKNLDSIDKKITSINKTDAQFQHKLRDYYIMSSHNSCCNGDYNNSYVTLDALRNVIHRGARVLDFEVYSLNNKTVIAASTSDNYYKKTTYNSLPFAEVMETIKDYCFSASTAPNFNDPLFLHFRIKSTKPHIFEDMATILSKTFPNERLPRKYNYEYNGENLGSEPLLHLLGKVIILCDKSNTSYENTKLEELINLSSNTIFLQNLRNYDLLYGPNSNDILENNRKHMSITFNDLISNDDNMNSSIHFKYGCQMVCMNFQSIDNNLIYYLEEFNQYNSAFILKPLELRYVPKYAKKPIPQNPKYSYAPKKIEKPYFKHTL